MDKKRTIGNITAGLMIATALLFDGIQALLTMSVFLLPFAYFFTFLGWIIFFLWFAILGVRYAGDGGRKLLAAFASVIVELTPVISALPGITAGVIGIIVQTRIEDARRTSGKKVTPRTAMASIRNMKLQQLRKERESGAREGREAAQEERHPNSEG